MSDKALIIAAYAAGLPLAAAAFVATFLGASIGCAWLAERAGLPDWMGFFLPFALLLAAGGAAIGIEQVGGL